MCGTVGKHTSCRCGALAGLPAIVFLQATIKMPWYKDERRTSLLLLEEISKAQIISLNMNASQL